MRKLFSAFVVGVAIFVGCLLPAYAQLALKAQHTGTPIGNGSSLAASQLTIAPNAVYSFPLPFSQSMWLQIPNYTSTATVGFFYAGSFSGTGNGFSLAIQAENNFQTFESYAMPTGFLGTNGGFCIGQGRMCTRFAWLTDGNWHHVCSTWSAHGAHLYIDRIERDTVSAPMVQTVSPVALSGYHLLGAPVPAVNRQREVAEWNKELSAADCGGIYDRGLAGFALLDGDAPASLSQGLIGYWNLDDSIVQNTGAVPAARACTLVAGVIQCPDGSPTNNAAKGDSVAVVSVSSPAPNAVLTGTTVPVTVSCTSTLGCSKVCYLVDDTNAGCNAVSPFGLTLNSATLLYDGPHKITVTGYNKPGNPTALAPISVTSSNGATTPVTRYIATTGSDANDGTQKTQGSGTIGPWLTPNHNIRCGDTILVEPGTYNSGFAFGNYGNVWSCPSFQYPTTGTSPSGAYMAALQCDQTTNVESCFYANVAMIVDSSHWAVIGGKTSNPAAGYNGCVGNAGNNPGPPALYSANGGVRGGGLYVAYINMMIVNCAAGSGLQDYGAIVGSVIANGAGPAGYPCFQGLSAFTPANNNLTDPATHIFVAGNLFAANYNNGDCTDGEGIEMDSHWQKCYAGQTDAEQNLFIGGGSAGYQAFGNQNNNCAYPNSPNNGNYMYLTANSFWSNGMMLGASGSDMEAGAGPGATATVNSIWSKNIFMHTQQNTTYAYNGTSVFASVAATFAVENVNGAGDSFTNNIIWSSVGTNYCTGMGSLCTTNGNQTINPGFASPALIQTLTPPAGPPVSATLSCAAYGTVQACLVGQGIIANFKPSGAAAALGYQPPGACTPNAQFPYWLTGIIPAGLITKPCGM